MRYAVVHHYVKWRKSLLISPQIFCVPQGEIFGEGHPEPTAIPFFYFGFAALKRLRVEFLRTLFACGELLR